MSMTATRRWMPKSANTSCKRAPFQLLAGDKEVKSGQVNVRVRGRDKAEGSGLRIAVVGMNRSGENPPSYTHRGSRARSQRLGGGR